MLKSIRSSLGHHISNSIYTNRVLDQVIRVMSILAGGTVPEVASFQCWRVTQVGLVLQ
jgi:hypothetical protein